MVEIVEEIEFKQNSEGWIEVKGSDILLKVRSNKIVCLFLHFWIR